MGACGKILIFATILISFLTYKVHKFVQPPPIPKLEETWWGKGDPSTQDTSIRPFKIDIPEHVLVDLNHRLAHARSFTPPLENTQQQYGMNSNLLKDVIEFWKTKYNWSERQAYLNQFPQFKTNIQGLDIHFIHVKPKATNLKVLPLLILHGWPGSVREFYDIIPILTTPQKGRDFVFEVIVPSLPGYGFSDAAVRPGLGATQMGVVFKNLMKRLNFDKFYTQGGDFGAIILQTLAVLFPENVLGYHTNMCIVQTSLSYLKLLVGSLYPTWFVREEHVHRVYPLTEHYSWLVRESGYLHLQATKPDTLGVGLKDSPVGLAAYILEKFVTGTNRDLILRDDGGLKEYWNYIDLLDNVMIYWVTGTMPTAIRLYSETFNKNHSALGVARIPVRVPSACTRFRYDFYAADGIIPELYPNMLQLTDHDGGHFAAFEKPGVFAEDVSAAVAKFEKYNEARK